MYTRLPCFMQVFQKEGSAQKTARLSFALLLEYLCFLCSGLEHWLQILPVLREEKALQTCCLGMSCKYWTTPEAQGINADFGKFADKTAFYIQE